MFFSRYYAVAPTCAPSRTAIFTGMYPTYLNAQHHHTEPDFPLRQALGAATARRGRLLHGERLQGAGRVSVHRLRQARPLLVGQHDEALYDSADFADLKDNQPFFAEFQCLEPHAPWHSLETYAEEGLAVDPDEVELPPYYPDTPEVRTVWAQYLSSVQVFDAKVGKVREMLEKPKAAGGHRDRRLDRSRPRPGARQVQPLRRRHPPAAGRVDPRAVPTGRLRARTVSDRLVSGVDISPTMLSLAGVELPPTLPGAPFLGPDAKERPYAFAHRDRVITHLDRSRAVVDKRYHYIRNYMPDQAGYFQRASTSSSTSATTRCWPRCSGSGRKAAQSEQEQILAETRPIEELFDVEQDPHQLRNLAEDPEYLPVLRRMRSALELWIAQTQDKGLPEPPEGAQKGGLPGRLLVKTTGGTRRGLRRMTSPVSPEFAKLIQ